jgi:hypothetical protein
VPACSVALAPDYARAIRRSFVVLVHRQCIPNLQSALPLPDSSSRVAGRET